MEFVLYSAQASFSWPRVDPGPAASASIFSVMRVGHTLLASIVLTFSGRCDEVFDGNNAGDIRHYCGIATSVSQLRILRLANAVDIYDLSLPFHFRWLAIHLHTETKDDS